MKVQPEGNMNSDAAESLFDGDIRVEKIIWLAGILTSPNDDFEELIRDEEVEGLAKIIGVEAAKLCSDEDPEEVESEEILQTLCWLGKEGFLVNCSTPIPEVINESGTYQSSWGYYTSGWFYTDAVDGAFVKGKVHPWRDSLFKAAVAKFKAKKGGA